MLWLKHIYRLTNIRENAMNAIIDTILQERDSLLRNRLADIIDKLYDKEHFELLLRYHNIENADTVTDKVFAKYDSYSKIIINRQELFEDRIIDKETFFILSLLNRFREIATEEVKAYIRSCGIPVSNTNNVNINVKG